MKAAFKKGNDVYLKDVESLHVAPGQIRVKVEACGICGTDIHEKPGEPVEEAFGHEMAGVITELGAGVTRVAVGDKVVLDSATPCGVCESCKNMRQDLCLDKQSFWFVPSFGMGDEIVAPAVCAVPYEGLEPAVACLQEPLGVAIDMFRLADIGLGSNVLVMGCGPIGLMALALAKRAGARRVLACELNSRPRRVELARQFGADTCIDPTETPLTQHPFDCKIDRIMVTAPPKALADAFAVAADGAIIAFIGIAHGDGAQCSFDANEFHFKKLQLRASFASPALFGPAALQYLRDGVIDGDALVSHRYPLSRIAEAMQTARTDPSAVKVVVEP